MKVPTKVKAMLPQIGGPVTLLKKPVRRHHLLNAMKDCDELRRISRFYIYINYTDDRDIKSAKTLLLAGRHETSCTCLEGTRTPEERKLDFSASYEAWKLSAKRPEAPSSMR